VATDQVREQAERLVAAALAAASLAARRLGSGDGTAGSFATGSAQCCICPVCRVIAAMRNPDDELTDRLVSGAGDLAADVANLLRAFSGWYEQDVARDHTAAPEAEAGPTATEPATATTTTTAAKATRPAKRAQATKRAGPRAQPSR
jgi:hypothetical protein